MNIRGRLYLALTLFVFGGVGKWVLADQVSRLRARESVGLSYKLNDFPMRLDGWIGQDIADDDTMKKIVADIKSAGKLHRQYTHPSGEKLVLWFNYSDRSLDQYHYPTVCLTGAGWEEDESQRKTFLTKTPPVGETPIVHFYFLRGAEKRTVHYWYYLIGEDPVDRTMRRLAPYARAFLRGRQNPSLTVEVFSQSPAPNMTLLDEFARSVAKQLAPSMPTGTESSAELGSIY